MFATGSKHCARRGRCQGQAASSRGRGFTWRGDCHLEAVCGVCEASAALHGPGMAAGAQHERGAASPQEPHSPQPLQQLSKPKSLQNISGLAWKPGVWQRGTYPEQLAGGGPSPDGFLFWEQRPPGASRPARLGGAGAASATFPHPHSQSPPGAWAPWSGWRLTSDQEADRSLVCSLGALGSDGSPLTRPRKLCQHVPESSGRTPSQAPGPGMSWPRANSRPRGVCVTCKRPRVAEQRTTWQTVTQLGP